MNEFKINMIKFNLIGNKILSLFCLGNSLKKYLLESLLIISVFFVLNTAGTCFAIDRFGCLTCHKYPGLAKIEKQNGIRVLHIDERKHLDSPHGKVDCRKCHPKIEQIPHTGASVLDCTTECHLKDKEKIKAIKSSSGAFHKDEKFVITTLHDNSSCRACHPLYPHSKNIKMRAFINMHTGFMFCEMCHLKKDSLKGFTYEWNRPEHVEFTGGPYGTHQEKSQETGGVITQILRIFSSQENQAKTEYVISRIAVFSNENSKKSVMVNTWDTKKAIEFKNREKNLRPEEKEKELKYFHKDVAKMEISVACNECHSPKGILDFKQLGFEERKINDLQYLNIKSLVTKYDVFYMPNLFGH